MNSILKELKEVFENETSSSISNGLRRNYCRKCGKPIVSSGRGIIRDICSGCGVVYRQSRRMGSNK